MQSPSTAMRWPLNRAIVASRAFPSGRAMDAARYPRIPRGSKTADLDASRGCPLACRAMIETRPYEPADLEALKSLVREPALAREFDVLQAPRAVEAWIADPFHDSRLHLMAFEHGELIGFASPGVMPGRDGRFAVARIAVREAARRRGVATALLGSVSRGIAECHPDVIELSLNAWVPSPEAEGFVARHGFARARTFWLMERPPGPVAPPAWPEGIRLAGHDESERRYRDFADAYNDSFEHHYHS